MAITLDGTAGITTPDLTDTSLTSTRVVYAGASGNLTGASGFTFDGTNFTVGGGSGAARFNVSNSGAGGFELFPDGTASGPSLLAYNRSGAAYLQMTSSALRHVWQLGSTEALRLNANAALVLQGGNTSASGVGVAFPATQSASSDANTLDDYEEGTWTPSYSGGLSGVTYGTVRNGFYTKIGNQVTVWFGIMTDGLTVTSSSLNISGLPFTSKSSFGAFNTVNLCSAVRWVSSPPIVGELVINTTTINLISNFNPTGAGTDPTLVTTGNMATGSGNRNVIYGTATYTV